MQLSWEYGQSFHPDSTGEGSAMDIAFFVNSRMYDSYSLEYRFKAVCFANSRVRAGTMSMGRETNGLKPVL